MKLESQTAKIIREMTEEGKVITLSKEFTSRFENELADEMLKIKEDFYQKERASRYYINQIESKGVFI